MPIEIKKGILNVKDSNGNYIGLDVVAQETTDAAITRIEEKRDEVLTEISDMIASGIIIDGQPLVPSGGSSLPASFGTSMTAFMTDIQALLNEFAYTVQNNHAATVSADAGAVIAALNGEDTPVTTYSVTATLSHCTSNNSAASIARNASYIADLTADSGYSISSVTVTMGGTDITSTVYNSATHEINIGSVTGNIVITATATLNTYTITNTLSHCATSNNASTATHGSSYSATLTADTDYAISSVAVTMGGTDITSTVYNSGTGAISIASVTGNIVITASAQSSVPVLSSVSAVFSGGDVYENTALNDLKQYMTVTATYSDSSTETVAANDYTLSGTLTVGTCAITVTYQGQTDTVSVHVLESVTLPSGYTRLPYIVANRSYFDTDLYETQVDHAKYELAPDIALMRKSNTNTRWNANIFGTDNDGYYYPCFKINATKAYGIGFRYMGNGGDVLTDGTDLLYAYEDQTPYIIEGLPVIKINGETIGTAKTGDYTTPRENRKFRFCHPKISANVRYYFYGRIYFFKAWDSSENLLAHYVPAKSSDNVVGLYDLVSNTFYSSAGIAFAEPTGV